MLEKRLLRLYNSIIYRRCAMFTGFQEETVRFFLDLRFHNNSTWFHENHDRYRKVVVEPFYELIGDLAPCVLKADPGM